jgi:hypothetical protein
MADEALQRSFRSMDALKAAFADLRCQQVLVKILATHQDNNKNQVYVSKDASALSMFPGHMSYSPHSSESQTKRASAPGVGIETLDMKFSWVWPDGGPYPAPNAKIIYYFQYPEARFSGFLIGCKRAPDAMRETKMDPYGRRALVLGIRDDEVLGAVVTDADGPGLINELEMLPELPGQVKTVFRLLPVQTSAPTSDFDRLMRELKAKSGKWWPGMVLKDPAEGPVLEENLQGSGWTLEAILGIPRNAVAGPDKLGFELKVLIDRGAISVTTTEPDFGYRKDHGLPDFLRKFGWPGMQNDGSLRFNGRHDTRRPYEKSRAMVVIDHWDSETNTPNGTGVPSVMLIHQPTGEVMAGWSFDILANKWGKKHNGCIYVDYRRYPHFAMRNPLQPDPQARLATHYLYGPEAHCGFGTNINRLLGALSDGAVYLDPGDRMYENGAWKKRMQWRLSGTLRAPVTNSLKLLYNKWSTEPLCDPALLTTVPIDLPAS